MSWGDAVVAIVRWAGVGLPPSTIGENDDPEPDAPRDPATPDPDAVDVRARVDEAPCRRASVVRPGGAPTSPDAPTPSTVAVGGVVADPERIGLQPDAVLVALGRRAAERGDDRGARDWFEQAAWSEEAILRLAELDLRAGRADDALDRVEREREILSRAGSRPGSDPEAFAPHVLEAWWAWVEGEAAFRLGDLDLARRRLRCADDAPGDRGAARLAEVAAARGPVSTELVGAR